MYPGKTEPMIKNTTHSSIGCNGMANNDDYHGLEMYKNHAKDGDAWDGDAWDGGPRWGRSCHYMGDQNQ